MSTETPYVKQTWTDGSGGGTPLSAARMGVIETGIFEVSYAPAVHVTHNASQSTTSGVSLALAFNTERYDQAGNAADTMHDNVTNNSRLTCRYAGVYRITGSIEWNALNGTGVRQSQIRLNGATLLVTARIVGVNDFQPQNVTIDYALAVNDYVELIVLQTSGAALNVNLSANYSPEFMMVRVG